MRATCSVLLGLIATLAVIEPAFAYIGPGAGLSMLGAFWGLLIAVFAALSFVLLWPVRRLFRRNASKPQLDATGEPAEPGEQAIQR